MGIGRRDVLRAHGKGRRIGRCRVGQLPAISIQHDHSTARGGELTHEPVGRRKVALGIEVLGQATGAVLGVGDEGLVR